MIELIVVAMVVGMLWLVFSAIGLVFKLTFGLLGGLFGLLMGGVGLLIAGVVMLLVVPLVALSLLPVFLPALIVVGIVWAIAHSSRRSAPPAATAR